MVQIYSYSILRYTTNYNPRCQKNKAMKTTKELCGTQQSLTNARLPQAGNCSPTFTRCVNLWAVYPQISILNYIIHSLFTILSLFLCISHSPFLGHHQFPFNSPFLFLTSSFNLLATSNTDDSNTFGSVFLNIYTDNQPNFLISKFLYSSSKFHS